jgi:hypothetical protein
VDALRFLPKTQFARCFFNICFSRSTNFSQSSFRVEHALVLRGTPKLGVIHRMNKKVLWSMKIILLIKPVNNHFTGAHHERLFLPNKRF